MELSFLDLIKVLIHRLKFILFVTLLFILSFYALSVYVIQPTYTSSVQLYVDHTQHTENYDLNDLTYAQKVVATYISILQTKQFYKQVIDESGLTYTSDQLKVITLIQDVNETEVFQISVTTSSANDSYLLTQTMQKIAPELIGNIISNSKIRVVDPAEYPEVPSGPDIILNTLIGGILGLILSVVAVSTWEIMNVKVKNQEELKKKYNIPILGCIPDFNVHYSKNKSIRRETFINRKNRKHKNKSGRDADFILNEAFKSLKSNLRFSLRSISCRKILVGSCVQGEGKSTICSNLAVTIAQSGEKVLLLDCDLRKGVQDNIFHKKSSPGVSDILSGIIDETDAIQATEYENLHLLTMGSYSPNPAELLGSKQMEELIKRLEKQYSYIIFDSSPVNVVADSLNLGKVSDGILLVIREGVTTYPNIASAMNKYGIADIKLLGFILNAEKPNHRKNLKKQYNYYAK